jgi:hypothetical protein
MTIYLYKKTHNVTGLHYLGKTIKDPFTYKGSGIYWTRHLEKYGNTVSTLILKECETNEELGYWGLYYSELWDIVESDEWANLMPETGDGGDTSNTPNYIKQKPTMGKCLIGTQFWNNGINEKRSKTCPGDDYVIGRLPFNNIGSIIGANKQRGKYWINNGELEMMISHSETIPNGYVNGRLESPKKGKVNTHTTGTKWWNNGTKSTMATECPGPQWTIGRIYTRKGKMT